MIKANVSDRDRHRNSVHIVPVRVQQLLWRALLNHQTSIKHHYLNDPMVATAGIMCNIR